MNSIVPRVNYRGITDEIEVMWWESDPTDIFNITNNISLYYDKNKELVGIKLNKVKETIKKTDESRTPIVSNARTLEEFVAELQTRIQPEFKPYIYHNKHGNLLEIVWKSNTSYSDWKNNNIDLERDMETKEIIGLKIWNISKLIGEIDETS